MDRNSGSASGKRPFETEDDKESEMKKRPRLQKDVIASFPNELWARIFSYLDMRDWGRLETVSSHFRTLLLKHSWTTLETLTVDSAEFCDVENRIHTHESLKIQCNSFPKFHLSFFCASKLLRGIVAKAPKLISLQLANFEEEYGWCRDEEEPLRALGLLPGLSSALRKFKIATRIRSMGAVGEVAQVLGQTKETLTELDLGLFLETEAEEWFVTRATEVLKPVLDSLNNLETLSIRYDTNSIGSSPRYNEYLLMNKPKLSDLTLDFLADYDRSSYIQPARALLGSKLKLDKLSLCSYDHYDEGFLSEYKKQLGSSSQSHPLSSLKRFDFDLNHFVDLGSAGLKKLLCLCPNVEEIYYLSDLDNKKLGSLIRFMGTFLNKFAVGERERVLQLNVPCSHMAFQEKAVGRLEKLTGLLVKSLQNVPCPPEYVVGRWLTTVPVKVFRKRNATFRLALRCVDSIA